MNFGKHVELGKIIKQIVESFDPELVAPFQQKFIAVISERLLQCKHSSHSGQRCELLDAIMSIILAMEDKFTEQAPVQSIVVKLFKNDDWNTRKLSVDISYSLLLISKETNSILHEGVKDLKYDKIKHVRESVNNYNVLHKQIHGDGKTEQPAPTTSRKRLNSVKSNKNLLGSKKLKEHLSKSPEKGRIQIKTEQPKSLEKADRSNR